MAPGDLIDVVIEIPRGSRNKYEYDHERHIIRLDRRLFSATVYPTDYGFVPETQQPGNVGSSRSTSTSSGSPSSARVSGTKP